MALQKKELSPALRSTLSLIFYLLILIVIWGLVGQFVFPQAPIEKTVAAYIQKYAVFLEQVGDNLIDENVNRGILFSEDSASILKEGKIGGQFADEQGATFVLTGRNIPEKGSACILYRPNGYVFSRNPSVWQQQSGTDPMYWTSPADPKAYVKVWKFTDKLYLEVTVQPGNS